MAWLFVDTHAPGTARFGWLEAGKHPTLRVLKGRGGVWLRWLAKQKARHGKIDGICVVAGPGSFSAVRLGVLHANLLARLWRAPLYGVTVEEAEDAQALTDRLAARSIRLSAYVAPVYDAEPNITLPKT